MNEADPLPVPADSLRAHMLVIDVVHTPETIQTPTALLAAAAGAGCQTQSGRVMHLAQIGEVADFFGVGAVGTAQARSGGGGGGARGVVGGVAGAPGIGRL